MFRLLSIAFLISLTTGLNRQWPKLLRQPRLHAHRAQRRRPAIPALPVTSRRQIYLTAPTLRRRPTETSSSAPRTIPHRR